MLQYLLQIIAAGAVGLILGQSNKSNSKVPAGRVFCIICMGSALLAIISVEYSKAIGLPWITDPGRISAQVVSALGFLGTGMVWISADNHVKGLPIAAGLWFAAILGILIGAGSFSISVVAIAFLLIINWLSKFVESVKKTAKIERHKLLEKDE